MQAHDLLARHRKQAEVVIVAQVVLVGERELGEVGERFQVVGMHAGGVEPLLVHRHVVIGMAQRPFQAVELQRLDLVARGDLDRVEIGFLGGQILHGVLLA